MAAAQLGDSLRSGRTQKSGYVQPRSFEGGPGVVIDCEQSVLFARNGVRVAFLSFGEVVVLKAYFFSAQFFLSLLLPLSFWGFPEFVYGIHLIFFESRIESLSLRSFRPSRPWERPMRARSTLEFQPASCAQSRASVPRRFGCL